MGNSRKKYGRGVEGDNQLRIVIKNFVANMLNLKYLYKNSVKC